MNPLNLGIFMKVFLFGCIRCLLMIPRMRAFFIIKGYVNCNGIFSLRFDLYFVLYNSSLFMEEKKVFITELS